MFNTISEAINWIEGIKRKEKRKDLSRIEYLLEKFGNPQKYFKIIHIAGTNGKGSVASYIKEIIMQKNYKVGCFISPYVIKFNERIMINDEYISDESLLKIVNDILPLIKEYEEKYNDIVPFFEVVTLIGFLYFKIEKIDYAVIECGLGGRLDATNFVNPVASVITNVGLDHQNSLGNTIEEIAYHKAGIIKNNTICFTVKDLNVSRIFTEEANRKKAVLIEIDTNKLHASINNGTDFIYDGEKYHTPLYGLYQANNASLAIAVCKYLFYNLSNDEINKGLANVFWPGRFEFVKPNILLDGAHNIHGVTALVETLKQMKYKKICCCFTALKDKNYDLMIKKLDEIVSNYKFVTFVDSRGVEADAFSNLTTKPYECYSNYVEAINNFDGDLLLITGSLHFISEVRKYYKN